MRTRSRLDVELVRRGLARSRQDAVDLVESGQVTVAGITATKVTTAVARDTPLALVAPAQRVVSRGAHKLGGALDHWPDLVIAGRRCLDVGASTGGFTQVLLRRGAASVVTVDVGYGQLDWSLRSDSRVFVRERLNARAMTPADVAGPVDVVVADLSFISLTVVLPAVMTCLAPAADLAVLVKPQFEAGRAQVGAGGVVRDPAVRSAAVRRVADAAAALGLGSAGVVASSLPGPAGNVEFFLWLRAGAPALTDAAIHSAVETGPQ